MPIEDTEPQIVKIAKLETKMDMMQRTLERMETSVVAALNVKHPTPCESFRDHIANHWKFATLMMSGCAVITAIVGLFIKTKGA